VGNLVAIDDADENLAVAVGLRKAKLAGHEDFAERLAGLRVDDGDRSLDFAVAVRLLVFVLRESASGRGGADGEEQAVLGIEDHGAGRGSGRNAGHHLEGAAVKNLDLAGGGPSLT